MSDMYDERHIPSLQFPPSRRSFLDYSRSLSESLATRPGLAESPNNQPGLGRWNGIGFVYDPPLHRMEESKPSTGNRYDFYTSCGPPFNDCFLSFFLPSTRLCPVISALL